MQTVENLFYETIFYDPSTFVKGVVLKDTDKVKLPLLLYAPKEYWQLTDHQREDICNGCGTKGICGWIVPDSLYGLSITEACNIHDYMYNIGETRADKNTADAVFFNNMLRLIDHGSKYKFLKKLRAKRAKTYYYFVKEFGGPAFWADKNKPEELGQPSYNMRLNLKPE